MSTFEEIRPFYDTEVNDALREIVDHPMLKSIMNFTFPGMPDEMWKSQLLRCYSIRDFQINFIYPALTRILEVSSEGLSSSGFDQLEKNTPYLFISNHRDIILDTSLLNKCLFESGQAMTTSAIGDNLIKKPFLKSLSRLTRNFTVKRKLPARELLESSKVISAFIQQSLWRENRSVWIAQREGRTKDGHDETHKGVLKMIAMSAPEGMSEMEYMSRLNIVPVSMSYEYDPTDALKMPELLAKLRSEPYVKGENEDFISLLSGIIGMKKRIHIALGPVLNEEIARIGEQERGANRQFNALAALIDKTIITNYRLWPTKYIAYDLLHGTEQFREKYSEAERAFFIERFTKNVDQQDTLARESYLKMYAQPVINQLEFQTAE
ncbi:MAG: 1-acyl-sn-glycerol-3-phosphate acyltransferase [Nitritalea sp.]